jgi:hypothetical protein
MALPRPAFRKFVRAVHVRYVVIRMAERAGLGVLAGCLAAGPLLAIALYRGFPVMAAAVIAIAIGMVSGCIHGWVTRPTELQSALEADRQLGWSDLLGTVITMEAKSPADPWVGVIRAEADFRSAAVSPETILLRRLGARAWGGIGLAAAVVIVLGLFPTFSTPTSANESGPSTPRSWADLQEAPQTLSSSATNSHRTPRQQDPDDPNASRFSDTDRSHTQHPENPAASDGGGSNHSRASNDPNGTGSGASQSPTARTPGIPIVTAGTDSNGGASQGTPAGGAGSSSNAAGSGPNSSSGTTAGAGDAADAPPWESPGWKQDVQRAQNAIGTGKLPDAYRDLIRDYFDPASFHPQPDPSAHDR